MAGDFRVVKHERWMCVTLPSDSTFSNMVHILKAAPSLAGDNLIIDASAIALADPVMHALLGDQMALHFKARKVAVVVPEDLISYNSERVAQSQQLNLRVFVALAEAQLWVVR
ncbi:MAG: hypothetical protein ABIR26_13340 [Ramlibacter sp.]